MENCMNYRLDRYGNKISLLGFGCMRLPQTAGIINKAEAEKQIMAAYNSGINYFDTAYIYPGSESAIGEIFEKNGIRKNINIATKLPHYLIKTREGLDKLFNEELKRLRTDYIDYYLMHMLADIESWEKLKSIGIIEWIQEKKASGQIRQIGFSYHGTVICTVNCWTHMTGIFLLFSITIWTKTPRQVVEGWNIPLQKDCRCL